jgi:hypothetical protein
MTLQDIAPRAANLDLKVLWADVGRHGHTKPTAGVGRSNIERMLCRSQRARQRVVDKAPRGCQLKKAARCETLTRSEG